MAQTTGRLHSTRALSAAPNEINDSTAAVATCETDNTSKLILSEKCPSATMCAANPTAQKNVITSPGLRPPPIPRSVIRASPAVAAIKPITSETWGLVR